MATHLKNLRVDRIDLVRRGASLDWKTEEGAHIILYKMDEKKGKTMYPLVKQEAGRIIDAEAKKLQQGDSSLKYHEAVSKVLKGDPRLYEFYRGQLAEMPVDTMVEKYVSDHNLPDGDSSWGAVVVRVAKSLEGDIPKGMARIRKEYPQLWNQYCREIGKPGWAVNIPASASPASHEVKHSVVTPVRKVNLFHRI